MRVVWLSAFSVVPSPVRQVSWITVWDLIAKGWGYLNPKPPEADGTCFFGILAAGWSYDPGIGALWDLSGTSLNLCRSP